MFGLSIIIVMYSSVVMFGIRKDNYLNIIIVVADFKQML